MRHDGPCARDDRAKVFEELRPRYLCRTTSAKRRAKTVSATAQIQRWRFPGAEASFEADTGASSVTETAGFDFCLWCSMECDFNVVHYL